MFSKIIKLFVTKKNVPVTPQEKIEALLKALDENGDKSSILSTICTGLIPVLVQGIL